MHDKDYTPLTFGEQCLKRMVKRTNDCPIKTVIDNVATEVTWKDSRPC